MLTEQVSMTQGVGYLKNKSGRFGSFINRTIDEMKNSATDDSKYIFPGTDGAPKAVRVSTSKPFIIIDGNSGCGKTYLSLSIMEQSLRRGRSVSYIGNTLLHDDNDSLVAAKFTALSAMYSSRLNKITIDKFLNRYSEASSFFIGEVLVVDCDLTTLSESDAEFIRSVAKVFNMTVVLVCQSFRDVALFAGDKDTARLELAGIVQASPLYKFISNNVSVIFSWGEYSLFNKTIDIGQFSVRDMHDSYISAVYIPEL